MGDETFTVVLELQGKNSAASTLGQIQNTMRGVAGESRNVNQTLTQMNQRFNQITNLAGMTFAGVGLTSVINYGRELYETGQEVNRARALFGSFSDVVGNQASMMDRLRTVTRGAVSDLDLMNGANSLMSMKIATSADDLEHLTSIAATFSQAMGTDVGGALEQISMIIANQSYLRLDSLGIGSGEVRALADQYKAAGMEAQEAFTQAFLTVADNMMPQMSEIADASISQLDRIGASFKNTMDDVGSRIYAGVEGLAGFVVTVPAALAQQQQFQANARTAADVAGQAYAQQFADQVNTTLTSAQVQEALSDTYYALSIGALNTTSFDESFVRNVGSAMFDRVPSALSEEQLQNAASLVGWMQQYYAELERITSVQAEAVSQSERYLDLEMQRAQSMQDRGAITMATQPLERQLQQMASLYGASSSGFYTSAQAAGGNSAFYEIEQTFNNLAASGVVSDAILAPMQAAVEQARQWRDTMVEGADALENLTLDQALFNKVNPNELLGDLQDRFLGMANTDSWNQGDFNALNLASGRTTELELMINQLMTQAASRYQNSPEMAGQFLSNMSGLLRGAEGAGTSDADIMSALGRVGTYGNRGFEGAFSQLGLDFGAAEQGAEGITAELEAANEQAAMITDEIMSLAEGVTVPIRFTAEGDPFLMALLAQQGLTLQTDTGTGGGARNNGGVAPGTSPRGNSTGGMGTRAISRG